MPGIRTVALRTMAPAAAVAVSLAVVGCGGGGGGGGPATPSVQRIPVQRPVQPPSAPPTIAQPPSAPPTIAQPPSAPPTIAQPPSAPPTIAQPPQTQQAPPAPPPPPYSQWNTRAVNLDAAIENLAEAGVEGAPGTGVTIGFVDSGFDPAHPALDSDRLWPTTPIPADPGDPSDHATATVSVAAAVPGNTVPGYSAHPLRGVAWGADIKVVANPPTPSGESTAAEAISNLVTVHHVDIVNLSQGVPGRLVDDFAEDDVRAWYGQTAMLLSHQDDPVLVVSAGNYNGADCAPAGQDASAHCVADPADESTGRLDAVHPELFAGLPHFFAEIRGRAIAVVATKDDGAIWESSNRCGLAVAWCIAAPGANVADARTVDGQFAVGYSSGTSNSAPMVAGGLAVMKQLFRSQLSNTELVARLFATANKEPPYDDAAVYGQGFMDLGAATAPVGEPALATGRSVDGPGIALAATAIRPGAALGDGIARALRGREVAAFDELGAPFWHALDSLASTPPTATAPAAHPPPARGDGVPPARLRFGETRPSIAGHMAIAAPAPAAFVTTGAGVTATAFTTTGVQDRPDASGATIAWWPEGSPAAPRAGWIGERETLVGTAASGAFGGMSGATAFAGLTVAPDPVAGWTLTADAEIGRTTPRGRAMLAAVTSPLTTSAFSVTARRELAANDEVTLRVSQPLRVEDATARFTVPTGRTPDGQVLRSSFTADLEPSGRQINVSAGWRRTVAEGASLSAAVSWIRHPRHDSRAVPEVRVLVGFAAEF